MFTCVFMCLCLCLCICVYGVYSATVPSLLSSSAPAVRFPKSVSHQSLTASPSPRILGRTASLNISRASMREYGNVLPPTVPAAAAAVPEEKPQVFAPLYLRPVHALQTSFASYFSSSSPASLVTSTGAQTSSNSPAHSVPFPSPSSASGPSSPFSGSSSSPTPPFASSHSSSGGLDAYVNAISRSYSHVWVYFTELSDGVTMVLINKNMVCSLSSTSSFSFFSWLLPLSLSSLLFCSSFLLSPLASSLYSFSSSLISVFLSCNFSYPSLLSFFSCLSSFSSLSIFRSCFPDSCGSLCRLALLPRRKRSATWQPV